MKKSAKLLSAVMAGAMVLSMAGCGSSSNSTETTAASAETTAAAADSSAAESKEATSNTDATVIKLGTTVNEQDSFQVCAEKFAELVKERTNGAYEIEIHPNGALGDERTMLESMQMGTLDMGIITSGPFVNFSSAMVFSICRSCSQTTRKLTKSSTVRSVKSSLEHLRMLT